MGFGGLFGIGAKSQEDKIALMKAKLAARAGGSGDTTSPWPPISPPWFTHPIHSHPARGHQNPPQLKGLGMFGLGGIGAATFEEKLAAAQAKAAAKKAKADAKAAAKAQKAADKLAAAQAKAAKKAEKAKVKASGGILSPETPVDYANIQAAVVSDEQAQMQQAAAAQAQQQAQTSQWMTYGAYALVAVGGFLAIKWYLGRKKS